MYDQQIGQQASQMANAIENNDLNGAAQMMQRDVQGMSADFARALISQTNQYTQQDASRDNTVYDQLRPNGLNYAGLPVVEFINGDNQVDGSVALSNIIPEQQYQQAPQQGYDPNDNQGYNQNDNQGYNPGYNQGYNQGYDQNNDQGCGGAAVGGAALGAGAGLLMDRRSPLAAGLLALGGGLLANNECEKR